MAGKHQAQIAVNIDLAGDYVVHHLKAVGLQHASVAGQTREPGQLVKEPGIGQHQVVFEIAVVIVLA